eukprot:6856753-Karenia_brevis.AAC.1
MDFQAITLARLCQLVTKRLGRATWSRRAAELADEIQSVADMRCERSQASKLLSSSIEIWKTTLMMPVEGLRIRVATLGLTPMI